MIAFVEGKLIEKEASRLVIDVNGIGYEIRISLNTFSSITSEDKVKLHTHLHVKEDSHTLYGFNQLSEKSTFLQLISISGVGPNTALMILSSMTSAELKSAIVNSDVKAIQSVKGIGSKTAQRIILELKDKLPENLLDESSNISSKSHNTIKSEALSALLTLGYSKAAAEKSIDKVMRENGNEIQLEDLIKYVLKSA